MMRRTIVTKQCVGVEYLSMCQRILSPQPSSEVGAHSALSDRFFRDNRLKQSLPYIAKEILRPLIWVFSFFLRARVITKEMIRLPLNFLKHTDYIIVILRQRHRQRSLMCLI